MHSGATADTALGNKEKDLNGYDDNDNDTYSNQSYGSNSGGNKSLAKTSPIKINSPNNKINNSATPSTKKLGGSPSTSANNWASKLKSSPVVTKGKGTTGGLINNDSSNLQQQRQQSQPRPAPQQVNNNNIQLEFDNNQHPVLDPIQIICEHNLKYHFLWVF